MVKFRFVALLLLSQQEAVAAFVTPPRARAQSALILSKPNGADDWMSSTPSEQPWSKVGAAGVGRRESVRPTTTAPQRTRGRKAAAAPGKQPKRPTMPLGRAEDTRTKQQERKPNMPKPTPDLKAKRGGEQQGPHKTDKKVWGGAGAGRKESTRPEPPSAPEAARKETGVGRREAVGARTTTSVGGKTYERANVKQWKEEQKAKNREQEEFISGSRYNQEQGGLGREPIAGGVNVENRDPGDNRFVRYNRKRDGHLILDKDGKIPQKNKNQAKPDDARNPAYVDSQTGAQYARYDKSQKSQYVDSSTDEFLKRVNPPREGESSSKSSLDDQQLSSGFAGFSGVDFSQPRTDPVNVEQQQQQQQPPRNPRRPEPTRNPRPPPRRPNPQQQPQASRRPRMPDPATGGYRENYGDRKNNAAPKFKEESPNILDSVFELLENQLRQLDSRDPKGDLRTTRQESADLLAKIDDLKARTAWKRQEIERLKSQVQGGQGDDTRDELRISREENAMLKKELESLNARAAWKRKQIEQLKARVSESEGGIPTSFGNNGVRGGPGDNNAGGTVSDPILNRSKQENEKLKREIEEMKARTEWKRNEIERLQRKVASSENFDGFSQDEDLNLSREENMMLKKEAEHLEARAAWKRKEIERLKAQIAKGPGPPKTRDLLRLQYLGGSMEEEPPQEQGYLNDFSGLEELDNFRRDGMDAPGRPQPRGDGGWEAFSGERREQESKREQMSSGRFQSNSFPRRDGNSDGPRAERKPVMPNDTSASGGSYYSGRRPVAPPQPQADWSSQPDDLYEPIPRDLEGPVDQWDPYSDEEMPPWDAFSEEEEMPLWADQAEDPPRSSERDAMFVDWPEYEVSADASTDGRSSPGFVGFSDKNHGEDNGNYVAPMKG